MEVSTLLQCPCRPGFFYKNSSSLKSHQKTKIHLAYESTNEVRDIRIKAKKFENEVERLKLRLEHKEQIEIELLRRITELEKLVYI
jgi:hypothetical protein